MTACKHCTLKFPYLRSILASSSFSLDGKQDDGITCDGGDANEVL